MLNRVFKRVIPVTAKHFRPKNFCSHAGPALRNTLSVALVDISFRILIILSSSALPQLSQSYLTQSLTTGPDLEVYLDCSISAKFLPSPTPLEGV